MCSHTLSYTSARKMISQNSGRWLKSVTQKFTTTQVRNFRTMADGRLRCCGFCAATFLIQSSHRTAKISMMFTHHSNTHQESNCLMRPLHSCTETAKTKKAKQHLYDALYDIRTVAHCASKSNCHVYIDVVAGLTQVYTTRDLLPVCTQLRSCCTQTTCIWKHSFQHWPLACILAGLRNSNRSLNYAN